MKKKSRYRIAVMGATGAVGQEMIQILAERKFPVETIVFLASERSAGKSISFNGKSYEVAVLNERAFDGIDLVLASAGGSLSKQYAPLAVRKGAVVIDNTSAFRMDRHVPLVIPEINANQIRKHQGIISNPNCSTIVLLVPIYPLEKVNPLRSVHVATYQAASGAGMEAMEELRSQSADVLAQRPVQRKVFPHQIAFNVFSHNSAIDATGYNEEEIKIVQETHKILNRRGIRVCVTCIRVPVMRAHSEALYVEFTRPMTAARVRRILSRAPGVRVIDDPKNNYFPMPLEASGRDEILVGRIRQDLFSKKSVGFFVSGDQLRKGAALNAVQIAEKLCGL